MSLDDCVARQQRTGEEIRKIAANYKNDAKSRKTLDYLNKRLLALEKLWDEFDELDSHIRINFGENRDHAYFTRDYYEGIRNGYERLKTEILNAISEQTVAIPVTQEQSTGERVEKQITDTVSKTRSDDFTTAKASVQQNDKSITCQNSLMKRLENILESTSIAEKQSNHFYDVKLKAIEHHWQAIQKLHNKLCSDSSVNYYNMDKYFDLEERTHEKLIQLREFLDRDVPFFSKDSVSMSSNSMSKMKLPKIELPKFQGDYLKWRQFRDLFNELVHNQTIPACQKMWYLKSSLSGEPEKMIQHLTTSDANYEAAWKIINERYENPKLLVNALLHKLISQPTIATESASSIRSLHDTTQECLLALQNLKISTENWDPFLLYILIKKLDRNTHTL